MFFFIEVMFEASRTRYLHEPCTRGVRGISRGSRAFHERVRGCTSLTVGVHEAAPQLHEGSCQVAADAALGIPEVDTPSPPLVQKPAKSLYLESPYLKQSTIKRSGDTWESGARSAPA